MYSRQLVESVRKSCSSAATKPVTPPTPMVYQKPWGRVCRCLSMSMAIQREQLARLFGGETSWGLAARCSQCGVTNYAVAKPLTLTHPDMTRFIITMPEAIALVDHALREMEGGEIFVPNLMAARMVDLAAALTDMPVHVSALRPGGEKLHETLMTKEEGARLLEEKPCWVIGPDLTPWRDRRWHYSGAMQPRGCASMEMGQITSQYTNKLTVEELREKVKGVPDV